MHYHSKYLTPFSSNYSSKWGSESKTVKGSIPLTAPKYTVITLKHTYKRTPDYRDIIGSIFLPFEKTASGFYNIFPIII